MSRFFSPKYLKYRDAASGAEILTDRPCAQCGYNLRGLKRGGQCPECGAPILTPGSAREALSDVPVPQLKNMRLGFWLAMVCLPLLPLTSVGGSLATGQTLWVMTGMVAVSAFWVLAVRLMTPALDAPGGVRRGFGPRSRLRHAARWMQVAWPVCYGLGLLAVLAPPAGPPATTIVVGGSALCFLVGLAGVVVLAVLMGRLAEWCQDDFAQRSLNWAVWGLSICTAGLFLSATLTPFLLLACTFVVIWLSSLISFGLGLASLARGVTWSVRHSREQVDRDRRLRERALRGPA